MILKIFPFNFLLKFSANCGSELLQLMTMMRLEREICFSSQENDLEAFFGMKLRRFRSKKNLEVATSKICSSIALTQESCEVKLNELNG